MSHCRMAPVQLGLGQGAARSQSGAGSCGRGAPGWGHSVDRRRGCHLGPPAASQLGGCAQPYLSRTGLLSWPTATDLPAPPPGMLGAGFVPSGLSWPLPASSLPREYGAL